MPDPRVLILGAGGMLGHKVFQAAAAAFRDTWCTLRGPLNDYPVEQIAEFRSRQIIEKCDATDLRLITALLKELRPDVVVNCIGVTKQRQRANDVITTITVNALLPHVLAATLDEWKGKLVHISTDCVFDGRKGSYTEIDPPSARDLYGRTKALGEVLPGNALTLRTSIIGRELRTHTALLDWFLQQDGRTVRGYQRAWWSGVTTNHLSGLVVSLITDHSELFGLYNVSSGRISKYDLLLLVREAFDLDISVEPDDRYLVDRSLAGTKLEGAIGYRCPPWSILLSELLADRTPYGTSVMMPS